MEVLYPRCAGLDVHKDVVVAAVRCVSTPQHSEVRSSATTTSGLLELSEWLAPHASTARKKRSALVEALRGRVTPHHRALGIERPGWSSIPRHRRGSGSQTHRLHSPRRKRRPKAG